jgi:hypothetical protein
MAAGHQNRGAEALDVPVMRTGEMKSTTVELLALGDAQVGGF